MGNYSYGESLKTASVQYYAHIWTA